MSYALENIKYLNNETIEKIEKIEEKKIIIKEYNSFEPIIVTLAKEKGLVTYEIKTRNKNIDINNINPNGKNSSNKLNENLSLEENKKNELNNINNKNDIILIKKNLKHSPPKKVENNLKKINNKEKINIQQLKGLFKDSTSDKLNKTKPKKSKERIKQILAYNDKELIELKFKLALKYDRRTLIQLYYSFLKIDHILIKILNLSDYNSLIIKIYLLFYSYSLSYTINALFFNDDTIHRIMEDEGRFNFLYQLPQIIYSSIISYLLNMILEYLALSEDKILEFKNERIGKKTSENSRILLNTLKFRFICFFILSFLFL